MSTGKAVPYARALAAAEDILDYLRPVCERIEVAGSVRREKAEVHDIEIVAVPAFEARAGLWEDERVNVLRECLDTLLAARRLLPHPDDPKLGDRYAKVVDAASGLQLDLFMVLPPAQWSVIFLIRTGSAGYSNWFVKAIRSKGYHITDGALHRGGLGCTVTPCEVVDVPEEADLYRVTGIPPTPPHLRTVG